MGNTICPHSPLPSSFPLILSSILISLTNPHSSHLRSKGNALPWNNSIILQKQDEQMEKYRKIHGWIYTIQHVIVIRLQFPYGGNPLPSVIVPNSISLIDFSLQIGYYCQSLFVNTTEFFKCQLYLDKAVIEYYMCFYIIIQYFSPPSLFCSKITWGVCLEFSDTTMCKRLVVQCASTHTHNIVIIIGIF